MIKFDNNLLQSWDGQRIFCLSDIPKKFEIIFFKDIITGNAVVNKKYINEYAVSIEDMCKIIGSSNYSFDDADPGIKRRVRALEFTDYYTLRGGVKKETGKMFPKDWVENDYLEFDNIMISCIQEYLYAENVIELKEMSDSGWIKQFEFKYSYLHDFIRDNINSWIKLGRVSNEVFNSDYSTFIFENNLGKKMSSHTINKALEDYCHHYKIQIQIRKKGKNGEDEGIVWKNEGKTIRGRLFGDEVVDAPLALAKAAICCAVNMPGISQGIIELMSCPIAFMSAALIPCMPGISVDLPRSSNHCFIYRISSLCEILMRLPRASRSLLRERVGIIAVISTACE